MAFSAHSLEHSSAAGTTVIRLEGGDSLPLLHRITTQSLIDLEPGTARMTLFCDFRGRLVHRTAVAVTPDAAVWLIRDDAPAGPLLASLDRHLFREDVRITDVSPAWRVRTGERDPLLTPGTVAAHDGVPQRIEVDSTWALVIEPRYVELQASDEHARIRAGRPRHGHEIHPDFNPFEVGLAHEVHLDKGCYVGQEALQRLITYQSVRRRIGWVSGEGPTPEVPREIHAAGAVVGRLTSACPDSEGWIGLAVLRHEAYEPGMGLGFSEGGTIRSPRPLPLTHPVGRPPQGFPADRKRA